MNVTNIKNIKNVKYVKCIINSGNSKSKLFKIIINDPKISNKIVRNISI